MKKKYEAKVMLKTKISNLTNEKLIVIEFSKLLGS